MREFKNYHKVLQEDTEMLLDDYKEALEEDLKHGHLCLYDFFSDIAMLYLDGRMIYDSLHDCADIITQSSNVETDSGMWEGQDPIRAIHTMAFCTYRNDLTDYLVEAGRIYLGELSVKYNQNEQELQEELREFRDNKEQLELELEKLATGDTIEQAIKLNLVSEKIEGYEIAIEELETVLDEVTDMLYNIDKTLE